MNQIPCTIEPLCSTASQPQVAMVDGQFRLEHTTDSPRVKFKMP